MIKQRLFWGAFGVFIVLQLVAVFWQIVKYEKVVYLGDTLHLSIRPFDPYDPFRGRYINLSFTDTYVAKSDNFDSDAKYIFTTFTTRNGTSKPDAVFSAKPDTDKPYLKTTNYYRSYYNDDPVRIVYPFDRFYMQEDLAKRVDRDNRIFNNDAKAVVKILDGVGVLVDVTIEGKSINEYIKEINAEDDSYDSRWDNIEEVNDEE
ncbi:MAG: GDYXXLXY domain-containing protein [Campylobacteraceae bacterium]|jgi:uncharacterized membrane-anchored protein|nr:GDYXXLXY domain-containing protein [Campylobacteraceae bacterium]